MQPIYALISISRAAGASAAAGGTRVFRFSANSRTRAARWTRLCKLFAGLRANVCVLRSPPRAADKITDYERCVRVCARREGKRFPFARRNCILCTLDVSELRANSLLVKGNRVHNTIICSERDQRCHFYT